MPVITRRPNFRARPIDQTHAETVAQLLQATGARVTPTAIMRHALAVAALATLPMPQRDLGAS